MANTKSAKKAIIVNKRNQARNKTFKTRMKNAIKNTLAAIQSKSKDVDNALKETLRIIDKTVAKGVIKKRAGARNKSRLAIAFNKTKK